MKPLPRDLLYGVTCMTTAMTLVCPAQGATFAPVSNPGFETSFGTDRYVLGASWADFDGDGDLDLALAGYSSLTRVYRNDGGTFVADDEVLEPFRSSAHACVWGDYDNDGFPDLFVARRSNERDLLYHNEGGKRLVLVPDAAPAQDVGDSVAASWADYDGDGWLDLLVVDLSYANRLYHNEGDGTFRRVSTGPVVTDQHSSVACAWGDYDNDGDLDLFVSNGNGENNSLYRNLGNGTFEAVTGIPPTSDGGFSTGADWGDYDNDGDLDLYVANRNGRNFLYQNLGRGQLARVPESPLEAVPEGSNGCHWFDYDNDGWLDLFVANWESRLSVLFRNLGDGHFEKITTEPVTSSTKAVGVSAVDLDNDGDLEVMVTQWDGPPLLYENQVSGNHWMELRLQSRGPAPRLGARVLLRTGDGASAVQQLRQTESGDGWHAGAAYPHFGLGDATNVTELRILWPSGQEQVLSNIAADQVLVLHEPISGNRVVPPHLATAEGSGAAGTLQEGGRFQFVYGAASFPETPIELTALSWRRDRSAAPFTDGLALLTVRLSSTAVEPDSLSPTFAANLGPQTVTVWEGPIVLASPAAGSPDQPAPFELRVPFVTPFTYDPAEGNLLVEVVVRATTGLPLVDQALAADDLAGRAFSLDPDAATAEFVDTGADVLRFEFTPLTLPLQITPPGGWHDGPELTIQIEGGPADATIRYTLDGTDPTAEAAAYEGPLTLNGSTVVKAAAFRDGELVGEVVTATYLLRSQPLQVTAVEPGADDQLTLHLNGWSGFTFEVEQSVNLKAWLPAGTFICRDGRLTLANPTAGWGRGFFRVRLVTP